MTQRALPESRQRRKSLRLPTGVTEFQNVNANWTKAFNSCMMRFICEIWRIPVASVTKSNKN